MNEMIRKIREWAQARNLINGSTAINQYAKLISEVGETAAAIPQLAYADVADGIGDSFVVLVIICTITGINMEDCCSNVVLYTRANCPLYDNDRVAAQTAELAWLIAALGKLGDALLKKDNETGRQQVINAVRSLEHLAQTQGVTLQGCAAIAYDAIKDRKGVMYNGAFIKSTDARYPEILRELSMEEP